MAAMRHSAMAATRHSAMAAMTHVICTGVESSE